VNFIIEHLAPVQCGGYELAVLESAEPTSAFSALRQR